MPDPRSIGGGEGSTATFDPLLQVMHCDFLNLFLMIMCVMGKDAQI